MVVTVVGPARRAPVLGSLAPMSNALGNRGKDSPEFGNQTNLRPRLSDRIRHREARTSSSEWLAAAVTRVSSITIRVSAATFSLLLKVSDCNERNAKLLHRTQIRCAFETASPPRSDRQAGGHWFKSSNAHHSLSRTYGSSKNNWPEPSAKTVSYSLTSP